jgi:hypothetical protein
MSSFARWPSWPSQVDELMGTDPSHPLHDFPLGTKGRHERHLSCTNRAINPRKYQSAFSDNLLDACTIVHILLAIEKAEFPLYLWMQS